METEQTQCSCSGAALVRCVSALNVFKTCSVAVKRAEPSGPTRHRASTSIIHTWGRQVCVCVRERVGREVCVQMLPESLVSVVSWMDKLSLNGPKHLSFIHPPFLIDLLLRWRNTHTHAQTCARAHKHTRNHLQTLSCCPLSAEENPTKLFLMVSFNRA